VKRMPCQLAGINDPVNHLDGQVGDAGNTAFLSTTGMATSSNRGLENR
jgi:hypothetical protein